MEITLGRKLDFCLFVGPVPILYTDCIDGQQVRRDDLFIATSEHLMQPGDSRPVSSLTIAEIDAEIERLDARMAALCGHRRELINRSGANKQHFHRDNFAVSQEGVTGPYKASFGGIETMSLDHDEAVERLVKRLIKNGWEEIK